LFADIYGNRLGMPKMETITETVHLSRLYKLSIDNQYVTRVHSPCTMEHIAFIKRDDVLAKDIWTALEEHYFDEAITWCYDMYDEEEVLVHHKAVSYFVSKNIFDFLFEPHWDYRVNCFINDRDGCLSMMNIRQSTIRKNFDLIPTEFLSDFRGDDNHESDSEVMVYLILVRRCGTLVTGVVWILVNGTITTVAMRRERIDMMFVSIACLQSSG